MREVIAVGNVRREGLAHFGLTADADMADVIIRQAVFSDVFQAEVVGDDAGIAGLQADFATDEGVLAVFKGHDFLTVNQHPHFPAVLDDGEVFVRAWGKAGLAAGCKVADTAGGSGIAFAQLPAIGFRDEVVIVIYVPVAPHCSCRFPGLGIVAAQLCAGAEGAAVFEIRACFRAGDKSRHILVRGNFQRFVAVTPVNDFRATAVVRILPAAVSVSRIVCANGTVRKIFVHDVVAVGIHDGGLYFATTDISPLYVTDFDGVVFVTFRFTVFEGINGEICATLAFADGNLLSADIEVSAVA